MAAGSTEFSQLFGFECTPNKRLEPLCSSVNTNCTGHTDRHTKCLTFPSCFPFFKGATAKTALIPVYRIKSRSKCENKYYLCVHVWQCLHHANVVRCKNTSIRLQFGKDFNFETLERKIFRRRCGVRIICVSHAGRASYAHHMRTTCASHAGN